jgi:hypothetical protein
LRDRALVRAFTQAQLDELPAGVCRHPEIKGYQDCVGETKDSKSDPKSETISDDEGKGRASEGAKKQGDTGVTGWCAALKDCGCCLSDTEWVLLGTVTRNKEDGISAQDTKYRRWVKPVEVLCRVDDLVKRINDLEASIGKLQPKKEDSMKSSEQVLSDGVVTPNAGS